MLCHVEKSIQMVPTSFQKQLSNQHPNLAPFWSQLGTILGGFWEPRWGQVGTKSLQKSIFKTIKKMITFWIASRSIFDRFGAPNGPQKGVTDLYILEHFGLLGSLGPKMGQDGPKTPPRRPPAPILDDFDPQLGRFRSPTWWILGLNLMDVGTQQPSNP